MKTNNAKFIYIKKLYFLHNIKLYIIFSNEINRLNLYFYLDILTYQALFMQLYYYNII